jgi:hypothetical protein
MVWKWYHLNVSLTARAVTYFRFDYSISKLLRAFEMLMYSKNQSKLRGIRKELHYVLRRFYCFANNPPFLIAPAEFSS